MNFTHRRLRNVLLLLLFLQAVGNAAAQSQSVAPTVSTGDPSSAETNGAATELQISGVYPHLTTYGVYSQDGAHRKGGHDECGIGAVVPWADKLWMVNYAPHMPRGSEHKLFSVDKDLKMIIHPESVGGTPAGRMIHQESNQLLIAHYLIDHEGGVRTISPQEMPIRVTAIARHLEDPVNLVYYIDMEGSIWEANVHTLAVKQLFKKPVPGWHGKGGYTGQGRLVVSNNGEHPAGTYDDLLVGGAAVGEEERGVLAQWDGKTWEIIERRQYTDVTGPKGIAGGGDQDDPIWAIGWDRRSLRLKLLDAGTWRTYLLPKASLCNDARHGWYTEWPRIRELAAGRGMLDMHGMFFDFPMSFSVQNASGIQPIGSHLRYVPDFCQWNDQLVLATDETSIQGNHLAGQPQSNLWFGKYEDLKSWGPANGYGGPWIEDAVKANQPSDPFLVAGFDQRILHLALGRNSQHSSELGNRTTGKIKITEMPPQLARLPRVTTQRGDYHQPAPGFSFRVNQPVTVYLVVDRRGNPRLDETWKRTDLSLTWNHHNQDVIYTKAFASGEITIPGNDAEHIAGDYGMPHMACVAGQDESLKIEANENATVTQLLPTKSSPASSTLPVRFTLEVDRQGNGVWEEYSTVDVEPSGAVVHHFPNDLDAVWLRLKTDRDCVATAVLHQTSAQYPAERSAQGDSLFVGLASASSPAKSVHAGLLYAAKRSRDLRVVGSSGQFFEFTKDRFEFRPDKADPQLAKRLEVAAEFAVDDASVIVKYQGKRFRLPKGSSAFDRPFASGWPRATREVESERSLANIHGTFYEVPLINNGLPPAFELMRPISSHDKQITDFASWNGLLVLAGVRADAAEDGHVIASSDGQMALWFGAIDDLWQLGKPVGVGGPWKETKVSAGQPSDPYLITGYDEKRLSLSADQDTEVTLEIDFDHLSGFHPYRTITVPAGEEVTLDFPQGFSAHWIRCVSSQACTVTAQLEYR
ncbi:hypothetical protein M4951_10390 [Blastopirellula sp. J2-11]|uniref:hypothetical protein n=1 Tax=Blastopirellula sp. J2-11 TaxID=2943192 RepID=UPI0021C6E50A|nr:hypothetical protein [Blastopirellula sp. J2-11]UUO08705.1 hypothetical protein M4951_10390 [Blastopirellula sp. J2-11]